ncbi:MAG: aminotransferase class IV [Candidatus Bilamarchaeaceae archaeon]
MSEFLISGQKKLNTRIVYLLNDESNPSFPLDADANWMYYSKKKGFIHPEYAFDTVLSNPIHYGAGGFEGIRVYYTQFGTIFPELESNIARLMFSTLAFDDIVGSKISEIYSHENVEKIEIYNPVPRELFEDAKKSYLEGREPVFGKFIVKKKDGSTEEIRPELRLSAVMGKEVVEMRLKELETMLKALAYANKLVSGDHFPNALEMVMAGYFRPHFWVSGEGGLKVPTAGKPFYFNAATLPWGVYLSDEYYETGLDVLYAPYERIGHDMPSDKKISGNYVNSALSINLARRLGYGEILAFKGNKIVEGSAENIYVFVECNGRYRVYIPPIGDGPLPGTTRDRVIRVLEEMRNVEIVYESPTKFVVEKAVAVLFSGTGAQLIHARSVNENEDALKYAMASRLASEDVPEEKRKVVFSKASRAKNKRILINNGEKHPILDEVRKRYESLVLQPENVRPVYDMDIDALGKIVGVDPKDCASKEEREMYRDGYMHDYKNYLKDVKKKTETGAKIVERAFKKAGLLKNTA